MEIPLSSLPLERRWKQQSRPVLGVVMLIRQADAFLLIQRNQNPYQGLWALVGGKMEFGESVAEAAGRETLEETGLAATFVALRGVVNERMFPAGADDLAGHFLLFVCEVSPAGHEAREQHEGAVAWFSWAELEALDKSGRIIPSDYAMLQRFGRQPAPIPFTEAEMVASHNQHTHTLTRFEQIN